MKKRLTVKDIKQLSDDQRINLTALWMPEIYDVAVASICKDITTEEYENYEFVVGRIDIINGRRILLHDIKSLCSEPDGDDTENQCKSAGDSCDSGSLSGKKDADSDMENDEESDLAEGDEEYSDEDEEFDIDYNYSRPTSFMREECYPLLSIGQMLDILQRGNPTKSGFNMTAYNNDMSCEIGTEISIDRYEKGFTDTELCDLLWDSVKTLL